ncbi:hypothetical protein [Paludisphaera borealis]|uniref:Uncharacterized protein n=1 Tax=Paludisphaera borealis TaxID=1387353 RepID=A0A1U7CKR2_9BACT|nr:hypothetical protein [Paludisphaera borealis]APW59530.1 hypothetical protein BSF38_00954 [Paludisphaera borealis]
MTEPVTLLEALTAAAMVSALTWAIGRWAGRGGCWVWCLAVGLGFYLGLAILGVRPRWPIREDQDRFLGLVLPGILAAEAVCRSLKTPSRLGAAARLVAATAVAPVLLHGSSYVVDHAGPGSAEWPSAWRWLIFGGLGLATACNWSGLVWIQTRSGSAVRVLVALATAALGAGLAVMLSGYASGGLTALPLAAAIVGASIAASFRAEAPDTAPGVGLIGLEGVLMMGAFFGRLRTAEAVVLFLAPLLAGIPEAYPLSRLGPRFRTVLGVGLTACAVAAATATTWRRFAADAVGL